MVTVLDYGVLKIQNSGEEDKMAAMFGGFAQVNEEGMSILTDIAEWTDEIDVARAEAAKKRAEERLASNGIDIDVARAELALKRALTRLNLTSGK